MLLWPRNEKRSSGVRKDSDSDAQLLERLKQRDQSAFLTLYDQHRNAIFRFLMHTTGSIEIAEELTQEVFVTVLDSICQGSIARFDPAKGTLEGYLIGIARNFARVERRRAHRLISLESVFENPEWQQMLHLIGWEGKGWEMADLMVARSLLKALYRAILELPYHYREALVLCSLEEKNYRDAAVILQCSEGTVASRINRAKALLAAKLRRSAAENTCSPAR